MNLNYRNINERGMTLIEILVAMLIGAALLAGVISIFVNSKQTYRTQEAMSRLQENARFAMDFLARDIRVADFWGCMRNDSAAPNNVINGLDIYGAGGLLGGQGLVNAGGNSGLDVADTITIRGLSSQGKFLSAAPGTVSANLTVTGHDYKVGEYLFVTDCNNGDIFQASAVAANTISHAASGTPGNSSADFSKVYNTDALVHKIETITYSIAAGASGLSSLFRSKNGTNEEIIEGVENMQVLYGIDTDDPNPDGIPNYYVPYDLIPANIPVGGGNPPGTDRIVSIRISFLLLSIDNNIAPKNVSVAYNGGTSTADRRLRKVVTSTINLRNR